MNNELKFRPDGTFKIVQLTDLHIGDEHAKERADDDRTVQLIEQILTAEQPDLVVLTGDLNWSHDITDPLISCRKALEPVVRSGIPWAGVFGNHDAEAGVTREELLAVQQEYAGCLTVAGPAGIHGVGNYTLPVKHSEGGGDSLMLYFFDSGSYAPERIGGYEWIHHDQIHWYMEKSHQYKELNGDPLPALAFFHIPLPEYELAWTGEQVTGVKGEDVECPKINSGLFSAMVEMGDVMGTFVGHDHDNDYCGTWQGIRMCFGRSTGYNAYGNLQRGARVINLQEGKHSFDTWIRQDDGEIIR
ncbi:metallophosphoesterase family protein [Paenibacillus sp. NPDC058174]|uniref:metallophosphoesterase family protein n=1 Tax=Paenibacillus sp. NPDC058174 TaxID=3346366 RepID=UPI0036DB76AD